MTKMYECVVLVRPIPLDFVDDVMSAGSRATVIDLVDDDVVILEFDSETPELAGIKSSRSATATIDDFIPLRR